MKEYENQLTYQVVGSGSGVQLVSVVIVAIGSQVSKGPIQWDLGKCNGSCNSS